MNLICPNCRAQIIYNNETEDCKQCGIPISSYTKLHYYPARLFNLGLSHAKEKKFKKARDCFAAIVHWYPADVKARHALAMACYELNDKDEARSHWNIILDKSPNDSLSKQGITALDNQIKEHKQPSGQQKTAKKRKREKKKRRK